MALNRTLLQQQRAAAEDTAKKIKLEKGVSQEFRSLFNRIASDSKPFIENFGTVPQLNQYLDEIRSLLLIHYRKTSDVFKKNFRRDQGLPEVGTRAEIDAQVNEAVRNHINQRATTQSQIINNTSSREMNRFLAESTAAALLAGAAINNKKLSEDVSKRFRKDGRSRADTIAMVETQSVAEDSKTIEVNTLVAAGAVIAGVALTREKTQKTWHTILDSKTRMAHALADGQTVPVDEPFIVDGQQLMQPGDTSLGASLDNVINCRCSSIVSVIE